MLNITHKLMIKEYDHIDITLDFKEEIFKFNFAL